MTATETRPGWYMSVAEAAEMTGLSEWTLYEWFRRGYDPATGTVYLNGIAVAHNNGSGDQRPSWTVIRAGLRQHAGLPADDDPRPVERTEIVMGF